MEAIKNIEINKIVKSKVPEIVINMILISLFNSIFFIASIFNTIQLF